MQAYELPNYFRSRPLLTIGISLTCDYFGRKIAIVFTTLMIVIGGIMATASHGVTIDGMFWMMTVARGVVGFGMACLAFDHQ